MSGEDTREALDGEYLENVEWMARVWTERQRVAAIRMLQDSLNVREAASRLAAPVGELGQRCNGCGHQWNGPAPVVLCGDCWRKTWPFIWGGVNVDAAPPPPAEARERVIDDAEATGDSAKVALAGYVRLADADLVALRAQVQTLTGALEWIAESGNRQDCVTGEGQEECIQTALAALRAVTPPQA